MPNGWMMGTISKADGKAVAKAEGGTGRNYKYKWDTGEAEATASKLALGLRTVTVTDENGCTATANIDITEDIFEKLDEVCGVELFKVITRYRFMVGIGKAFTFTEVRNNIEKAVINEYCDE